MPEPDRRGDPDEMLRITRGELRQTVDDAAQRVGRIHRRRILVHVFAVCMLVLVPIGYYAYQDEHQFAKRIVAYQCGTIAKGRVSGNYLRFALQELLSFDTDIITTSEHNPHQTARQRQALRAFLNIETKRLQKDAKTARRLAPGLPNVSSYADLFQFFKPLPLLNCDTQSP